MNSTKVQSLMKTNRSQRRLEVLDWITKNPGCTRGDLNVKGRFHYGTVNGRVNELIKMGLVKVTGTTHDNNTGRNVETLEVV